MNDKQRAKKAQKKKTARLWAKVDKMFGLPVKINRNLVSHAPDKVIPKRKKQKARKYAKHASHKESTIPRHSPSDGGNRDKSIKGLSDGNLKHRYNVTDY